MKKPQTQKKKKKFFFLLPIITLIGNWDSPSPLLLLLININTGRKYEERK